MLDEPIATPPLTRFACYYYRHTNGRLAHRKIQFRSRRDTDQLIAKFPRNRSKVLRLESCVLPSCVLCAGFPLSAPLLFAGCLLAFVSLRLWVLCAALAKGKKETGEMSHEVCDWGHGLQHCCGLWAVGCGLVSLVRVLPVTRAQHMEQRCHFV